MIRELSAILCALVFALIFSQVPRFVDEYEQRLGGALAEAQGELAQFEANAREAGLSFDEYVRRHVNNADPAIVATGHTIDATIDRVQVLQREQDDLALSSRLLRPVIVLREGDRARLAATWRLFTVLPTLEPTYGIVGLAIGWLIHTAIWAFLPRRRRAVRF